MRIIISPFSKQLRDVHAKNNNPKNFPYWKELIVLLKQDDHQVVQVGTNGEEELVEERYFNLNLTRLRVLLESADCFISVDNFFHHFAHFYGKRGIVIFAKSDPDIYGYKENVNLLKHRRYLRPDQFGIWESIPYDKEAFVSAHSVREAVKTFNSTLI